MDETMEIKIGSKIYGLISTARMTEAERQVALNAMRDAELIVDAAVWVARKIEQFGSLFMKPSLKA
jgi:hypothetical protein